MKEIDFEEFYKLCQTGCSTIIDVREVDEFETLHLERTHHLPLSQWFDIYGELDKNQLHYVICKSGMRSACACQFLEEHGCKVINVQGGMDGL